MVLTDNGNRSGTYGIFGEHLATDVINNVLIQFGYGLSTYDLRTPTVTNGGTATVPTNMLTVTSGTNANGTAEIESINSVRYRPGHTAFSQFTAIFTNYENTGSEVWIGLSDGVNGIEVGVEDGLLAVRYIKNGTSTTITQGSFNGYYYGPNNLHTFNPNKLNVYRIMFAYLGGGPITIEVLEENSYIYRPIHTFFLHNKISETHIDLPYLPMRAYAANSGNTTAITVQSGSWQAGVFGTCTVCGNRGFQLDTTATSIGTGLTSIMTFRSKDIFGGNSNKIRSIVKFLQFLPYAGTGLFKLYLVRPATLNAVAPDTYLDSIAMTDVDATNSTLEYTFNNVPVTVSTTGLALANYIDTTNPSSADSFSSTTVNPEEIGLYLDPGEIYCIAGQISAGTASCFVSVNWTELF